MKKILIAEDDAFILDIASVKLKEHGYRISKTADGESVIPILRQEKSDLLILDLLLPNKHGLSILAELRDTPDLADIPVIIFSNENGPDIEAKAKDFGAKYFFKAMTGTGALVNAVDSMLT